MNKEILTLFKHSIHGRHDVYWAWLYEDENNPISTLKKHSKNSIKEEVKQSICFASAGRKFQDLYEENNVPTHMFVSYPLLSTISQREAVHWLQLCKVNKLLPKELRPRNMVISKTEISFVLDLRTIPTRQVWYVYLSMARYLAEEPTFVKTVLTLVERGWDFLVAFKTAHVLQIQYSGHSILEVHYPTPIATEVTQINLRPMLGLITMLKEQTQEIKDQRKELCKAWCMDITVRKFSAKVSKNLNNHKVTLEVLDKDKPKLSSYFTEV